MDFQRQAEKCHKRKKKIVMAPGDKLEVNGFYSISMELEEQLKKKGLWKEGQLRAHVGRAILRYVGLKTPPVGKNRKSCFHGLDGLVVFLTPKQKKTLLLVKQGILHTSFTYSVLFFLLKMLHHEH